MTLSAKRKISQRQKRASPSHLQEQSAQTEDVIHRMSCSSRCQPHREVTLVDGEFYEEQSLLYERLLKAEEVQLHIYIFLQIFRIILHSYNYVWSSTLLFMVHY